MRPDETIVFVPAFEAWVGIGEEPPLREARIAWYGAKSGRYELKFRDRKGVWRTKHRWVFTEVYASHEHYAASQKANKERERVAFFERAAAAAMVRWCEGNDNRAFAKAAVAAHKLIRARARLAKLEAKCNQMGAALPHIARRLEIEKGRAA